MITQGISANLALDQEINRRRARGERLLHLGFGETRLPVHSGLVEALLAGAHRRAYGPVAGDEAARAAVAGYFGRRRLPTEADQVVLAPGSKPLLFALIAAVDGDVLLPRPCWLTYAPQARLLGRRVFWVDVPAECGGVPDPDLLASAVHRARAEGGHPRLLIMALPDNPTGTTAPPDVVRRICDVAGAYDLVMVADEIYRDLAHDPDRDYVSPAEVAGDRTVITTGLSKTHALGGWRAGAARFPAGARGELLRSRVLATASEVWSSLAGPVQSVVEYAFGEPPDLADYVRAGARMHAAATRAVHQVLVVAGANCRAPSGGFYLYPDFRQLAGDLARQGVHDSASLERELLHSCGIAVLGGHHFGDDPAALRFRAATSLLFGDEPEAYREAMEADDPMGLPAAKDALRQLADGLARLTD
ncbi:pyridoxal phosphate-dependent aminotransferase [Micromonospora sp. WMMD812]|uniref:pyridoxal phosphate-dependent aminotransferase n=1 Tax=Micromonospora sp. WMMD812 TaxID=3015152 RepID=UPI00248C7A74|nr:pyridoxal phosphate-dependent aminotransferase [Micromonospora sp. WMMD812]WBB69274.1 pyridoxal phosphate-dependent aminotransferase [Micromonospora sp. WMMD812]